MKKILISLATIAVISFQSCIPTPRFVAHVYYTVGDPATPEYNHIITGEYKVGDTLRGLFCDQVVTIALY